MTLGNGIEILVMRYWLKKTMLNKHLISLRCCQLAGCDGIECVRLFSSELNFLQGKKKLSLVLPPTFIVINCLHLTVC